MGIFDLNNTVAVVTGAGRGNGNAIARSLSQAGAVVVGVDEAFSEVSPFTEVIGDVTFPDTLSRALDRVRSESFGHLVLVNNAGVSYARQGAYPEDLWRKTLEVNLTAPFLWIEGFAETFRNTRSGSIINITSLGAERAFPDNPAYQASKGGLKMLGKYYAKALAVDGIRVNNVGPGYLVTEMTRMSYSNTETRKAREQHTMLGRWGSPDDLAGVCVFLASPASSYITAQDIYVDGGWLSNGLVR